MRAIKDRFDRKIKAKAAGGYSVRAEIELSVTAIDAEKIEEKVNQAYHRIICGNPWLTKDPFFLNFRVTAVYRSVTINLWFESADKTNVNALLSRKSLQAFERWLSQIATSLLQAEIDHVSSVRWEVNYSKRDQYFTSTHLK